MRYYVEANAIEMGDIIWNAFENPKGKAPQGEAGEETPEFSEGL
jgi:hypothetical protein